MDRNALTEQRRENVIGLLKGMNIKKSDTDGFDRDSVYECMQKLCDLYEQNIEELENTYESEIIELKDKYQKYDDNNDLYVSLIMEAKKSSNEIINQAKSEVENILNEGKAQVAKQEQELEQMHADMEAEKQAIISDLSASREAMEAEKAAMRTEVEAEKEKAMALKNKYSQQMNAMESEFAEIKTNILRTAGRIDSLKSKLPEDNEVNWNVVNDVEAVDFPVGEIGVEETITPNMTIENDAVAESVAPLATPQEIASQSHVAQADVAPTAVPAEEGIPEINLDSIEVDLPDFKEESADNPAEEISFEGLEELFKEDN